MRTGPAKVFLAVLSLLFAAALQLKFISALGWSFDFFLLAIIIPAFFLDAAQFIFFGIFAAFLSGILYPFSLGEAAALALFPVIVFALKRILFWQSWFEPLLATMLGIFGFYSLVRAPMLANGFGFLAADIAVSFVFAWGLYAVFGGFKKHGR